MFCFSLFIIIIHYFFVFLFIRFIVQVHVDEKYFHSVNNETYIYLLMLTKKKVNLYIVLCTYAYRYICFNLPLRG